ncbi:unnamed protein product, partial [Rotaria socialis]
WLKTGSTGPETEPLEKKPDANIKPFQQQSTNPFDSNLTDENLHGKSDGMGERRPSIPLSLFIPRAAKDDSTKVTETSNDD